MALKRTFRYLVYGSWDEFQEIHLTQAQIDALPEYLGALMGMERTSHPMHRAYMRLNMTDRHGALTNKFYAVYRTLFPACACDYSMRKQRQLVRLARRLGFSGDTLIGEFVPYTLEHAAWFRLPETLTGDVKAVIRVMMRRTSARAARLL